ncbi:MAG: hypothetical protein CMI08_13910 [Oceanospirillaceae bacterium]|nr:hypothetical protein [Thalassolituus sp.]MAS23863.1 hypothetical protein [Oceanospirillaceae bacterium]MAY00264.1 hypothetical protein [Oceanospirillaceae bacterium]MBL34421.1 hypothetical protein [Oceanospirillaceae bacterium]MBS54734.1 hypothetical protein [Oceanospirillaceae bacterium]|tara:strand:+ start:2507 stop:2905 length:399 start_codon:yes stop_codon:yes gene_type:complete
MNLWHKKPEKMALPDPATEDTAAEVAYFFPSGRTQTLPCLVYEVARDFLSAPRQYCLLQFDEEAWMVSASDAGDELDYGLVQQLTEDDELQLIFNWPDRCIEVVCQRTRMVERSYHGSSAAEVLVRWLAAKQ